jgi:hypothetical protein
LLKGFQYFDVFEKSFELDSSKDFAINYGDYRKDYLLVVTMVYEPIFSVNSLEEITSIGQHILLEKEYYFHASMALITSI